MSPLFYTALHQFHFYSSTFRCLLAVFALIFILFFFFLSFNSIFIECTRAMDRLLLWIIMTSFLSIAMSQGSRTKAKSFSIIVHLSISFVYHFNPFFSFLFHSVTLFNFGYKHFQSNSIKWFNSIINCTILMLRN